jgi:hypothetical protein
MQFVRPIPPLLLCAIAMALAGCASQNSGGMPSPPSPSSPSPSGMPTPPTAGKPSPAPAPLPTPGKTSTPPAPSSPSGTAMPSSPPGSPGSPGSTPQSTRTASAQGGGTADGGKAQTPDERRAAIDRRLEGSLGTFDETLRKEQKTAAEEKDAHEASTAGSAESEQTDAKGEGSEGGSAKPENPPAEASEPGRKADGPSRPGDLKSDQSSGSGTAPKGTGGSAGNIPDGSDDDIVAKRLRKAAEQETDPELKEKLWKEYIDYKKNAGN